MYLSDLQFEFIVHECLNRKSHGQLRYDSWRQGGRPVDRTTSSSRSEEYGCTLCALITIYSLVTQKVHFINLLRERIKLCIYSSEHTISNWKFKLANRHYEEFMEKIGRPPVIGQEKPENVQKGRDYP